MSDPRERLRERLQEPSSDARQRLRERLAEPEESTTALGSFLTNLLKGTGDAVLSIPSATGDLLAMGAAGIEGTARGLTPGGEGFEFGRRYREEQQKFPASAIRAIPRPTTNEIIAGGRAALSPALGGLPMGEAFENELSGLEATDQQMREEHPIASGAGQIGGTVASLLLTKKPLQGTIRRAEQRLMQRPDMFFGAARTAERAPGVARLVDRTLKSHGARLAARGGFRAAETGLEAAYLEVLSEAENDPMLAAGIAAGGQLGASATSQGLKGLLSGGPTKAGVKLGVAAFGTWSLWQMVKSATPGGRDRILESIESGYDKVTYAVLLGALGGLVGGRLRDAKIAEDLPNLVEAFSTIPRGAALGLLTDMVHAPEDEQAAFESTLEKLQSDPSYEGESDLEKRIIERLNQIEAEE